MIHRLFKGLVYLWLTKVRGLNEEVAARAILSDQVEEDEENEDLE